MKLPLVNLVLTVFLLWLTIQLQTSYEVYLAYFFILTVGIIHGANDISLINLVTRDTKSSTLQYLGLYLAVILLMSIAFFQFPTLALAIFIAFSCYHFGEQHFYHLVKGGRIWSNSLYFFYGALIFGLLFYLNSEESASIILELTGKSISENDFLYFLVTSFALTILVSAVKIKRFTPDFNPYQELFLLLVFALIFKLASLLWAFAIYFVIWHSIPSLRDQTFALHGSISKSSVLKYFKSSLPNWLISIIGLAIIYYVSSFVEIRFVTLFFAFLAAITIPHVIVMYFLNKK